MLISATGRIYSDTCIAAPRREYFTSLHSVAISSPAHAGTLPWGCFPEWRFIDDVSPALRESLVGENRRVAHANEGSRCSWYQLLWAHLAMSGTSSSDIAEVPSSKSLAGPSESRSRRLPTRALAAAAAVARLRSSLLALVSVHVAGATGSRRTLLTVSEADASCCRHQSPNATGGCSGAGTTRDLWWHSQSQDGAQ